MEPVELHFIHIPIELLTDKNLSVFKRFFLCYIMSLIARSEHGEKIPVSPETMAKELETTSEEVRESLRSLDAQGFIDWKDNGSGSVAFRVKYARLNFNL